MADQNFRAKNGLSVGIGGSVITTSIGGNVGLGSTNPTTKLWVSGDGYFVGVVTSSGFYVDGSLIGSGSVTVGPIVGTALSISGISTSAEFVGGGSDLRNLSGTHLVTYASHSETSNSALSIAGISTYTQVGILTGSLAVDASDIFGNSVATSADGKTIIVGAQGDEIGVSLGAGIVYVFDRIGNSFNQVGILTGVDANDNFGNAVATSADGKTIVVGARSDEIGATSATGVVYVFDRIGNSFNQVGILTGSYAIDANDNFGTAVATSANGKTIIVGALSDEIGATGATGVVYVFDRIGNSFNQVGILTGSYATAISDAFGTSIATSADGKTIVVSAPSDEIGATTGTGIVYVFDRIGNSFNEVGILTGSYAVDTSDAFGTSVATSADGKTIIVGASGDEIDVTTGTGIVYVFDRIGNSFNQVGILTGSYAIDAFDQFGSSIATSADGKTIVVGARGDEIGATSATGVVYVFKRQANSFNQVGILTGFYAVDANDNFGQVVTISADGKSIIVGVQFDEIGATAATGVVYVFDEVRDTYVYSGPTGNIGIGSTNPTSKLWVSGDGYFVGVVTATKFYGDGSQLSGLTAGVSISTNTTNQSQFIPYVTGTGSTSGFGVTTTGLVFNPSSNSLGIGTTNPTSKLTVQGDVLISGVTTSGITRISSSAVSPNITRPVATLEAVGGSTDYDIAIVPKGNGAIVANIPDGTSVGGNKRGTYAVDLQLSRSTATHVASGENSFIGNGHRNTASGNYSAVLSGSVNTSSSLYSVISGGNSNTASGEKSFIGNGEGHTASGNFSSIVNGEGNHTQTSDHSIIAGGSWNSANGSHTSILCASYSITRRNYSSVIGGYWGDTRNTYGAVVFSGTNASFGTGFSAGGGYQQSRLAILSKATTDSTPSTLTADGNAYDTSNVLQVVEKSAYLVKGSVIAYSNASDIARAWEFTAVIKKASGDPSLVGTPIINDIAYDSGASGWSLSITADSATSSLKVEVTGQASTTIRWVTKMDSTEVAFQ